jgi:Icc-related predicted phosphoesterase
MNILVTSDWHGRRPNLPTKVLTSAVDLLVLCGDTAPNYMANWNMKNPMFREVDSQAEALSQLRWRQDRFEPWLEHFSPKVKTIIEISGNHDFYDPSQITGIHGLKQGSKTITVEGMKIGLCTGMMPLRGEWHDEVTEATMEERIKAIDPDIDFLVTHCPPLGIMDQAFNWDYIGCKALTNAIFGQAIGMPPYFTKLKTHCYGHCHEQRGTQTHMIEGREVSFYNAAETYFCLEDHPQRPFVFRKI